MSLANFRVETNGQLVRLAGERAQIATGSSAEILDKLVKRCWKSMRSPEILEFRVFT